MDILKKISKLLNTVYMGISVLLLIIVIVSTAVQVFTRYVMNASLSGTEEIARFAFVWMSMMGASICVNTNGHAVVSILGDSLKKYKVPAAIHDFIVQVLIVFGSMILLVYGLVLVQKTGMQRSAGLGISMSYTYACIPVGALGMVVNGITNIAEDLLKMKGGDGNE